MDSQSGYISKRGSHELSYSERLPSRLSLGKWTLEIEKPQENLRESGNSRLYV